MGEQRPGGWVPGIGWVALSGDLADADEIRYGLRIAPENPNVLIPCDRRVGEIRSILRGQPYIVTRWADGTTPLLEVLDRHPAPAPSAAPVPPEPAMHIIRRADGDDMGEFSFFATDGPDGWDVAENTDHDDDTTYEILACYPVARRKFLWSTLCQTCGGEGDGCPACAGTGEQEAPDAERIALPWADTPAARTGSGGEEAATALPRPSRSGGEQG